jgi:hypothetical protein
LYSYLNGLNISEKNGRRTAELELKIGSTSLSDDFTAGSSRGVTLIVKSACTTTALGELESRSLRGKRNLLTGVKFIK